MNRSIDQQKKNGCLLKSCLLLSTLPFIILLSVFIPLPQTPYKIYPVTGEIHHKVKEQKISLFLGTLTSTEPTPYGIKRYFKIKGVHAAGNSNSQNTLQCKKMRYRINGGDWREAELITYDRKVGKTTDTVHLSPVQDDLDVIDATQESFKLRLGTYDLLAEIEDANGVIHEINATLQLEEKSERQWRSIRDIFEGLSGIN